MNAYERAADLEIRAELTLTDPIKTRFLRVYFVSMSKGAGRRRVRPVEITLIADLTQSWISPHFCVPRNFPFDCVSTEIFPELSGRDAERLLIRKLGCEKVV